MNATIYSTDGSKYANFTSETPVPDTNKKDWDGTSNGMNDYYGKIDTDNETQVQFWDDEDQGGDTYTVGPNSSLPSLQAVFDHKVGSFEVSYAPQTPTATPPGFLSQNKAHAINLRRIICNHAVEDNVTGGDDVYIQIQADAGLGRRIPKGLQVVKMEDSDVFYPADPFLKSTDPSNSSLTIYFDYELLVMVWDQDISLDPNTATFLVNHQFVAGQYERSDYDIEIVLTNQNGASYTIVYNTHGCS